MIYVSPRYRRKKENPSHSASCLIDSLSVPHELDCGIAYDACFYLIFFIRLVLLLLPVAVMPGRIQFVAVPHPRNLSRFRPRSRFEINEPRNLPMCVCVRMLIDANFSI